MTQMPISLTVASPLLMHLKTPNRVKRSEVFPLKIHIMYYGESGAGTGVNQDARSLCLNVKWHLQASDALDSFDQSDMIITSREHQLCICEEEVQIQEIRISAKKIGEIEIVVQAVSDEGRGMESLCPLKAQISAGVYGDVAKTKILVDEMGFEKVSIAEPHSMFPLIVLYLSSRCETITINMVSLKRCLLTKLLEKKKFVLHLQHCFTFLFYIKTINTHE